MQNRNNSELNKGRNLSRELTSNETNLSEVKENERGRGKGLSNRNNDIHGQSNKNS